jgi:tetratricopeptide (TPR) repeat protein
MCGIGGRVEPRGRCVSAIMVLLGVILFTPSAAQPPSNPPTVNQDPCGEGERLFRERQYGPAEPLLKDCLQTQGDQASTLMFLNVIAVMEGRPQEGEAWGRRALALDSLSADGRYWYGRALLEQGRTEAARVQWEAGFALSMDHKGILEGLARLAMDAGEDAKAYNLLNQLLRQGVDEAWVHGLLSELARRKGLWAAALQHWREFMAREGEDEESLLTAGELSILAGDTAMAVTLGQKAVALSPTAASYGGLGEALFAADRHPEALEALRKATAMDPDEPRYQFNLANVLELLGEVAEAEAHFKRYVELTPDDAIGRLNYSIHLDRLGKTETALQQVDAALSMNRSLVSALVLRGQLLEKLGRYDEVLAVVDTLLARDKDNSPQLQRWRSEIVAAIGETERARQEGQVHLFHIMTPDSASVPMILEELSQGTDFSVLATRFSLGPTANQGGDIGWVTPSDMIEPMRSVIAKLRSNEISEPVRSGLYYHIFKRVR